MEIMGYPEICFSKKSLKVILIYEKTGACDPFVPA